MTIDKLLLTTGITVRDDLAEWLVGFDIDPTTWRVVDGDEQFEGTLSGHACRFYVTACGFGLPHAIAEFPNLDIELGLIEADDYDQDGSDPLVAVGWDWRRPIEKIASSGWTDRHHTCGADALAAAIQSKEE